jgi:hypothetical protein
MKKQIGILTIVAAITAIGLFYPQQKAKALPGWGGTKEKNCMARMCVSGCNDVNVELTVPIYGIPVGISISLDSGATYELVPGTERSCGEDLSKYCSWDWGCKA